MANARPRFGSPRSGVLSLGLGTALAGILGWVTLTVAARVLGPLGYAFFAVLWGAYYGFGGALAGLQQEVTRAVAVTPRGTGRRSVLVPAALIGLVLSAFAAATSPWWSDTRTDVAAVAAVSGGLLGLTGLVTANGLLSVGARWSGLAGLAIGDALVRLLAVSTVVVADANGAWLAVAISSGSLVWLPLLVWPPWRQVLRRHIGLSLPAFAGRALPAMLATGCAGLLIGGFPMLVSSASGGVLEENVGALLAAMVLVRTPLLMVLNGYRPILLSSMLGVPAVAPLVRRIWGWCLASGSLLTVLAWLLGPTIVRLVYGSAFEVARLECALLTVSGVMLTMLTVSGLALVAADAHVHATTGWFAALLVTVAILLVPGPLDTRLTLGAAVGPVVGCVFHTLFVRRL